MSGTDSSLFTTAMKLAQEAVQLDNAKQTSEAYQKYLQAAEVLNDFIKFCKNPKLNELAQEKAKAYLARANAISNIKDNKQKVSIGGPTNKSAKGGKSAESDKPSDDNANPEEKGIT